MKKKTICFDIDGIICSTSNGNYHKSKPIKKNIKVVNSLYDKKYKIILYTARYMGRFNNNAYKAKKRVKTVTINNLKSWGVKYNQIFFGKPSFDFVVDDKSVFFKRNWAEFFKKFK
tara:strand:- start:61 stop:408 length:348 start_codon:yes stop_codon:yes gene_type:complete